MRADARRNADLVLAAARRGLAAHGIEVSYHEIARLAGVGVGTVYRRYPDRRELLSAILLEVVDELYQSAREVMAADEPRASFRRFFIALAWRNHDHADLYQSLEGYRGADLIAGRDRLINEIRQLTEHLKDKGIVRRDLNWMDIPFLAKAAGSGAPLIGSPAEEDQAERCIGIILDGILASCTSVTPESKAARSKATNQGKRRDYRG